MTVHTPETADVGRIPSDLALGRLLDWADQQGRKMPWRGRHDAYAVATAEILLQKTKARDVVPVWKSLIARYPSPADLIAASSDDLQSTVAKLGLGKQRAARLRRMAACLQDTDRCDRISGLGSYGQAIVELTLGTGAHHCPVDGNIARVVCRYSGLTVIRGEPRKQWHVKDRVRKLLELQNSESERLQLVYALVDLGALVCTPRLPKCIHCPLKEKCSFALAAASD